VWGAIQEAAGTTHADAANGRADSGVVE
jgi:hypothetical protein